jgi:hypothetical protein
MFHHAGFRSLWPVILLLPWFFVGVSYLLAGLLARKRDVAPLAAPVSRSSRRARSPMTRTNAFIRSNQVRTFRFGSAVASRARRTRRSAA